jgi:hypothetical protein
LVSLLGTAITLPASQGRIIRLSYVDGDVQVHLSTASAPQPAILNMSLTEGMRLITGDKSLAEVEFENGSTLRLAGRGMLWFPQLSISDAEGKLSAVEIQSGIVYFNLHLGSSDHFVLLAGGRRLEVPRSSHFRVRAGDNTSEIAVFQGQVDLLGTPEQVTVRKGYTLTLPANDPASYALTHKIASEPSDAWDRERQNDLNRYANAHTYEIPKVYENEPYPYAFADLTAYGVFQNIPAYGYLWQPYHYGQWVFIPGRGWFWVPGAAGPLVPWRPVVPLRNPSFTFIPQPPRVGPKTPVGPGSILVVRNGAPRLQESLLPASVPSAHINPKGTASFGTGAQQVPSSSLSNSAPALGVPLRSPATSAGSTFAHGTNLTNRGTQRSTPKVSPPMDTALPSHILQLRAVPAPQIRPAPLIRPVPMAVSQIPSSSVQHVPPGLSSPGVPQGRIGMGAQIGAAGRSE